MVYVPYYVSMTPRQVIEHSQTGLGVVIRRGESQSWKQSADAIEMELGNEDEEEGLGSRICPAGEGEARKVVDQGM